jgi:hypothetical protein
MKRRLIHPAAILKITALDCYGTYGSLIQFYKVTEDWLENNFVTDLWILYS